MIPLVTESNELGMTSTDCSGEEKMVFLYMGQSKLKWEADSHSQACTPKINTCFFSGLGPLLSPILPNLPPLSQLLQRHLPPGLLTVNVIYFINSIKINRLSLSPTPVTSASHLWGSHPDCLLISCGCELPKAGTGHSKSLSLSTECHGIPWWWG